MTGSDPLHAPPDRDDPGPVPGRGSHPPIPAARRPPWRGARESYTEWAARRHLVGRGIEIGALFVRQPLGPRARAWNVDRRTPIQQQRMYPQIPASEFCPIDVVADGSDLAAFPPGSLDFVIASHVLEHLPDPLGSLRAWFARLRPGGHLLIAVPDRDHTIGRDRPVTSLDHLLAHMDEGTRDVELEHFEEWARHVEKLRGERARARARELRSRGYPIHAHVWRHQDVRAWLDHLAGLEPEWRTLRWWRGPEIVVLVQRGRGRGPWAGAPGSWLGRARDVLLTDGPRALVRRLGARLGLSPRRGGTSSGPASGDA